MPAAFPATGGAAGRAAQAETEATAPGFAGPAEPPDEGRVLNLLSLILQGQSAAYKTLKAEVKAMGVKLTAMQADICVVKKGKTTLRKNMDATMNEMTRLARSCDAVLRQGVPAESAALRMAVATTAGVTPGALTAAGVTTGDQAPREHVPYQVPWAKSVLVRLMSLCVMLDGVVWDRGGGLDWAGAFLPAGALF